MIKYIQPKIPAAVQEVLHKGAEVVKETKAQKSVLRKAAILTVVIFFISLALFVGGVLLVAKLSARAAR